MWVCGGVGVWGGGGGGGVGVGGCECMCVCVSACVGAWGWVVQMEWDTQNKTTLDTQHMMVTFGVEVRTNKWKRSMISVWGRGEGGGRRGEEGGGGGGLTVAARGDPPAYIQYMTGRVMPYVLEVVEQWSVLLPKQSLSFKPLQHFIFSFLFVQCFKSGLKKDIH